MKMICFDLDGSIVDLYAVPHWLDKLQKEDASPYLEAAPMWDMEKLRQILLTLISKGYEIRVISWLAKNSSEEYKTAVRQAKIAWLEKYNFPAEKCHFVAYGTTKADCIRRIADAPALLIDDNKKVRDGWHMGETIDPTNVDLLEVLSTLDQIKGEFKMKTHTDKFDMALFTEKTKNSFKEIFKRMGWELEETGDIFNVTYPMDDEYLMDFLIDSMI